MSSPVTVLVLTPSTGGFYFGELLAGLGREVTAAGGRLVLVQTDDGATAGTDAHSSHNFTIPVAWAEVDGVVSVTTAVGAPYLQRLRDAGKPIVLVSTRMPDFAAPIALPDNHGGTLAAVEHLISHGHERIGFVGNFAQPDVLDRYDAYLSALATHGLPADPALRFEAPDNEWAGGISAAHDVLASSDRPTALMVATDRNAIGLMRTLSEAGLVIPRDIAVIGFDNIEAAAFSTPTLSTVDQRFDDVGALAGRLLLSQVRGEDVSFTAHVPPSAQIELRGSCGCVGHPLDYLNGEYDRPAHESAARWRDELTEALCTAARTGDSVIDSRTHDAALDTVTEAERLVRRGNDTTADDIAELTTSLRLLTSRPDVLRRITREVIRFVTGTAGTRQGGPTTPPGLRVLTTALWQLQAGAFHRQTELTETALEEQFAVDAALLGTGSTDPRQLDWLAGTHVPVGVLALWDDPQLHDQLRIVGTYDADGALRDLVGTTTAPEHFPPAELIGSARTSERRACIVVPISGKGRDWGVLAVIGEVRTTSTLEPYRQWASQLCSYLEGEDLQEAVRASEERYALASRATNDGLWEWTAQTGDLFMSERCRALLGLQRAPDTDRLARWEALVHPGDVTEMRRCMQMVATGNVEIMNCEYRVRQHDGSYRWVLSRALGVPADDGSTERLVGSLSDIHERRCLEDQLRENALHDALTGLPNRRNFLVRLNHAIELWRRFRTPYAVIFLDLDRFKAINDTLGHQMGDGVLCAVGARMQRELRGVDIGARFGGDEFAILLHDVGSHAVVNVARRIQLGLAQPIEIGGHTLSVGASIGIATSALNYTSAEDVLAAADAAMYHAKESARGTICLGDATPAAEPSWPHVANRVDSGELVPDRRAAR